MSGINNIDTSLLQSLKLQQPEAKKNDELGQADFLRLLVTQLKNQNPSEPQNGAEFLGQMAQFGTLDSIQKMSTSMENLASSLQSSQALQASSLVGRAVRIPSSVGYLGAGGSVEGLVQLPSSVPDLKISIFNSNGELVKQLNPGLQPAGDLVFNWGGIDDNGEGQPPGLYKVVAEGTVGDQKLQLNTLISANVDSVSIGSGNQGTILNLQGLGSVSLSEVKELQ